MRHLTLLLMGALIISASATTLVVSSMDVPSSLAAASQEKPATSIVGLGYVEPAGEIRRLGFKIDGRIYRRSTEVGDQVKAGTILLVLDDSEERAAVAVAEAELASANADLAELLSGTHPDAIDVAKHTLERAKVDAAFAQREHDRLSRLRLAKSTSDADADRAEVRWKEAVTIVDSAEAELERLEHQPRPEQKLAAEARVKLAESLLQLAEARLDQTILRAPTDGTVLEIHKRKGDIVRAIDDEPAILFADLGQLRIRAEVDERFVHQLREGMTARIYGRTLGHETHTGEVTLVKRVMGPKTVFARSAVERIDLDVVQLFIDMPPTFQAPVGLRVDVRLQDPTQGMSSMDLGSSISQR